MNFDTLVMKAVALELQSEAAGALVRGVLEPGPGEVALPLYRQGRQFSLLFSTDPQYARVHLAGRKTGRSKAPSPFCMLLRKYLVGGRPLSFSCPRFERIMFIDFEPAEGMPPVRLIAEIMGRRSNLVLISAEGKILGAARTSTWEKNPRRAVVPGEPYRPVPPQEKLDPVLMSESDFYGAFGCPEAGSGDAARVLVGAVNGVSPLLARELLYRCGWESKDPAGRCRRLFEETVKLFTDAGEGRLQPVLYDSGLYAAVPLAHLEKTGHEETASVGAMLDRFYNRRIAAEKERQLQEKLKRAVEKRLTSLAGKKEEQSRELKATDMAPLYRLYGDLLLTYGDRVERGAKSIALPDLHDPEKVVEVPLDPSLSAGANARRFFNRYRKAKSGRDKVRNQIKATGAEIEYCAGLLYTIENAPYHSLEEVAVELAEAGYLKQGGKRDRKAEARPAPLSFRSSSGATILVGRNNRQNDYITFKAAVRRDTWFHARELPGSHVLLKEVPYPPPAEDAAEAAFLAAFFSRGRESGAVAVDYTAARHVRRRPGGKPGAVFYENYETITVNPGERKMLELFGLEKGGPGG